MLVMAASDGRGELQKGLAESVADDIGGFVRNY